MTIFQYTSRSECPVSPDGFWQTVWKILKKYGKSEAEVSGNDDPDNSVVFADNNG